MNKGSSVETIADALTTEIDALSPGARLPSNRQLVARFNVSASTVSDALSLLAQRGRIETRPGIGVFVARRSSKRPRRNTGWQASALDLSADLTPEAPRTFDAAALRSTLALHGNDLVDLNSGYLHPDLQPLPVLQRAFTRAARNSSAWTRPPTAGIAELRTWFARDIGGDLGSDDVTISPGGQGALATILRALTQPGDPVIVESPTYPGTIAAARAAGLRPVAVPVDDMGLDVSRLDDVLERTRARVVVVQPLYQNPTGATLTASRRVELLNIAHSHECFVVEDDFARYLRHADEPRPPAPLVVDDAAGAVIHVRSLTKVASPNVRIAGVVSRGPVSNRLREAFIIENMVIPAPLQYVALEAVGQAGWRRHQTTLADELASRRREAVQAISEYLGPEVLSGEPEGGYHLWLRLADGHDSRDVAAEALRAGVAVTPGFNYEPRSASRPHVRVSYVAAPTSADVVEGIRRLRNLPVWPGQS